MKKGNGLVRVIAVMLLLAMLAGMVPVSVLATEGAVDGSASDLPEEKADTRAAPTTADLLAQINNLKIPSVSQVSTWTNLSGEYFLVCSGRTLDHTQGIKKSMGYLNLGNNDPSELREQKNCLASVAIEINNGRVWITEKDANAKTEVSNLTHAVYITQSTKTIPRATDISTQFKAALNNTLAYGPKKNSVLYNLLNFASTGTNSYTNINVDKAEYKYNIQFKNGKYFAFGMWEGIELSSAYPIMLYPSKTAGVVKMYKSNANNHTSGGSFILHSYLIGVDGYQEPNLSMPNSTPNAITAATPAQIRRNNYGDRSGWNFSQQRFNTDWKIYKVSTQTLDLYRYLKSTALTSFIQTADPYSKYSEEGFNGFLVTVQQAIKYYNAHYTNTGAGNDVVNQCNAYKTVMENTITMLNKEASIKASLNGMTDPNSYMDVPITVLDFRADGLLFETENTATTSYTLSARSDADANTLKNELGLPFPGKNDGLGARIGLTLDRLVDGFPVYTEETVAYIARSLIKKHKFDYAKDDSKFDPNRNKTFINLANGWTAANEGTWEDTLKKVKGQKNGGILHYSQVETAFDLAYYMLNNIWRPIQEPETVEGEAAPHDILENTLFPVKYNMVVPELTTLRLKKDGDKGFYTFTSDSEVGRDLDKGIVFNTGNAGDSTYPALNILTDLGFEHPDKFGNDTTGIKGDHNGSATTYDPRTNFNYGLHARIVFTYYDGKNQQFTFKGDDDVYFFVNGVLACDVGGMHGAVTKTLKMDDIASELDLYDGDICTFDMFFVDRHTTGINLYFSTNIEMMNEMALTREDQYYYDANNPRALGQDVREATVVPDGTEMGYNYKLFNRGNYGLDDISFTDSELGIVMDKDTINLNDRASVNDLTVQFCTHDPITFTFYDGPTVVYDSGSFDDFYRLIQEAMEDTSTITPLGKQCIRISGLTEDQLKAILDLGIPANSQLEIWGMHKAVTAGDSRSSIMTRCYPLNSQYVQGSVVIGRASRGVEVIANPNVTLQDPLQIVMDYGKTVELTYEDMYRTLEAEDGAVIQFLGFTKEGEHGLVTKDRPSNLKCAEEGDSYRYGYGVYELRDNVYRFTPDTMVESIQRINGVYSVSFYMDTDSWYIMATIEILPANMVYYEAEDFAETVISYEESVAGTVSTDLTTVRQEDGGRLLESVLNNHMTGADPANDQNMLYIGFGNSTADQNRYSNNPIYGGLQLDQWSTWFCQADGTYTGNVSNGVLTVSKTPDSDPTDYAYIGSGKGSTSPANKYFPMKYVPKKEDWMEIRFRINATVAVELMHFKLELFHKNSTTTGNHYNQTWNVSPEAFADGYIVISDYIGRRTLWDSTSVTGTTSYKDYAALELITRINLLFGGMKADQTQAFSIDYFYLGPKENRPSAQGSHLLFDYSSSTASQYRYGCEAYGMKDYNPVGSWTGSGTSALAVTDGALKLTAASGATSCSVTTASALHYRPSARDFCQVRLKVENATALSEGSPYFKLRFTTEGGSTAEEVSHFKLASERLGQWFILTIPITHSAWYEAGAITSLSMELGGMQGQGSYYIDYCYVGPSQGSQRLFTGDTYGYDRSYEDDMGLSNGASLFIQGKGIKKSNSDTYSVVTFSFTGTGFDLIGRTDPNQATLKLTVQNSAGAIEKTMTINTKGELKLYQIPVVSVEGLAHDRHSVTIEIYEAVTYSGTLSFLSRGDELYLDGIRIYDPIDTSKTSLSVDEQEALTAYEKDKEAYPFTTEVRDILLSVGDFNALTGATEGALYVDMEKKPDPIPPQPLPDGTPSTEEPTSPPDIDIDNHITGKVITYEKVGPKNEVYLDTDRAIALLLRLNTEEIPGRIDIGAKAITTTGTPVLSVGHTGSESAPTTLRTWEIKTNTAQYYSVSFTENDFGSNESGKYLYLVIKNTGESILSITDLRFAYETKPTIIDSSKPPVKSAETAGAPVSFLAEPNMMEVVNRILNEEVPPAQNTTVHVDHNITIRHSLNLTSDISINYAVSKASVAQYSNISLSVTIPQYVGNTLTDTVTKILSPVEKGEYLYFTLEGLTAVNMGDQMDAVLTMDLDGESYRSTRDFYSIAQYAYSQLDKSGLSPAFKTLCADLLRYGAKAQSFKDYRTEDLVDSGLTEEQRAYLTDLGSVTFGSVNSVGTEISTPSVTWVGKSLDLASKVGLKFVFSAEGYEGAVEELSLHVSYTNKDGTQCTAEVQDPTVYNEDRKQYAFLYDDLLAAELRTAVTVQIYHGDTPLSCTLQYSADTYGNGKTETLGQLCKALFAYSDSARAFFTDA